MPQRAGIEQDEFPHGSVGSLENWPIRAEFVDRAHPFLVCGIIGVVRDFSDFTQSLSRRF